MRNMNKLSHFTYLSCKAFFKLRSHIGPGPVADPQLRRPIVDIGLSIDGPYSPPDPNSRDGEVAVRKLVGGGVADGAGG